MSMVVPFTTSLCQQHVPDSRTAAFGIRMMTFNECKILAFVYVKPVSRKGAIWRKSCICAICAFYKLRTQLGQILDTRTLTYFMLSLAQERQQSVAYSSLHALVKTLWWNASHWLCTWSRSQTGSDQCVFPHNDVLGM